MGPFPKMCKVQLSVAPQHGPCAAPPNARGAPSVDTPYPCSLSYGTCWGPPAEPARGVTLSPENPISYQRSKVLTCVAHPHYGRPRLGRRPDRGQAPAGHDVGESFLSPPGIRPRQLPRRPVILTPWPTAVMTMPDSKFRSV